jgi:hypothetical protein
MLVFQLSSELPEISSLENYDSLLKLCCYDLLGLLLQALSAMARFPNSHFSH